MFLFRPFHRGILLNRLNILLIFDRIRNVMLKLELFLNRSGESPAISSALYPWQKIHLPF